MTVPSGRGRGCGCVQVRAAAGSRILAGAACCGGSCWRTRARWVGRRHPGWRCCRGLPCVAVRKPPTVCVHPATQHQQQSATPSAPSVHGNAACYQATTHRCESGNTETRRPSTRPRPAILSWRRLPPLHHCHRHHCRTWWCVQAPCRCTCAMSRCHGEPRDHSLHGCLCLLARSLDCDRWAWTVEWTTHTPSASLFIRAGSVSARNAGFQDGTGRARSAMQWTPSARCGSAHTEFPWQRLSRARLLAEVGITSTLPGQTGEHGFAAADHQMPTSPWMELC